MEWPGPLLVRLSEISVRLGPPIAVCTGLSTLHLWTAMQIKQPYLPPRYEMARWILADGRMHLQGSHSRGLGIHGLIGLSLSPSKHLRERQGPPLQRLKLERATGWSCRDPRQRRPQATGRAYHNLGSWLCAVGLSGWDRNILHLWSVIL